MNDSTKPLLIFLVCIAALFYLYTIINAGLFALGNVPPPDPWMITTATIIGGILSTNLGAVLGITIVPPNNLASSQNFHPKVLGLRPSISGKGQTGSSGPQKMQIFASYFYVASLVVALIFTLIAKDHPSPFLIELRNTLAGVIVGALTVSLGK